MGLLDYFRRRKARDATPEAQHAITHATRGPVYFEGGRGHTVDEAVVILGAPSHGAGVRAEYDWLTQRFGTPGKDWTLINQALVECEGRPYDQLCVRVEGGAMKVVFFDLHDCFERRA